MPAVPSSLLEPIWVEFGAAANDRAELAPAMLDNGQVMGVER